jgi:hypothetical protein
MKKVILAFDGKNFSEAAFDFVKRINEESKILLTGVFLPQMNYSNLWSYADGIGAPMFVPSLDDEEIEQMELNVSRFENSCKKNDIEFRIRKDAENLALPELKKESRFADLLVIGEEKFYQDVRKGSTNHYVTDAIHEVECPVVLIPEKYHFPELNVLAYDGSESSVFAIKQFAYLFPEFSDNPTLLSYANDENNKAIPYEPYIEELAARHFSDLTVSKLDFDSKKYYATWIANKKSGIIVSGSLGRSTFSQMFKKSFISDVIMEHQVPIFIAHK